MLYLAKQALPGGPKYYKIDRDGMKIVTDSRNITTVSIRGRSVSFRTKSCEIGG